MIESVKTPENPIRSTISLKIYAFRSFRIELRGFFSIELRGVSVDHRRRDSHLRGDGIQGRKFLRHPRGALPGYYSEGLGLVSRSVWVGLSGIRLVTPRHAWLLTLTALHRLSGENNCGGLMGNAAQKVGCECST